MKHINQKRPAIVRNVVSDSRMAEINKHIEAAMRLIEEAKDEAERLRFTPVPMEPRRVWHTELPDAWNGGRATGDALIDRAVAHPEWFERLVKDLTEKLPTDSIRFSSERKKSLTNRAIAVRLLQAFYDREAEACVK